QVTSWFVGCTIIPSLHLGRSQQPGTLHCPSSSKYLVAKLDIVTHVDWKRYIDVKLTVKDDGFTIHQVQADETGLPNYTQEPSLFSSLADGELWCFAIEFDTSKLQASALQVKVVSGGPLPTLVALYSMYMARGEELFFYFSTNNTIYDSAKRLLLGPDSVVVTATFIDEAARATECECWFFLGNYGPCPTILVGDPKQLLPVIKTVPMQNGFDIAIIAPYRAQVRVYQNALAEFRRANPKLQIEDIAVNTVDYLQGGEAPVIFLNLCVTNKVGFMKHMNRVNVATFRVQDAMYILMDIEEIFGGVRPNSRRLVTGVVTYFQNRGMCHHIEEGYNRNEYLQELFVRAGDYEVIDPDHFDYEQRVGFRYSDKVEDELAYYWAKGGATGLYDILGINSSATEDQIRKAFIALSLKWHPGKNNNATASEGFMKVIKLNDVLSYPVKRKAYDWHGQIPIDSITFTKYKYSKYMEIPEDDMRSVP
ncbi:MAG: hypothetical protein Q9187_007158, partial [Circinaria calcarea]